MRYKNPQLVAQHKQICCMTSCKLKGPSQPPPFSMPSKLLILHGDAKSDCFTIGFVPESMFRRVLLFHRDFLCFDMLQIKFNSQTLVWTQCNEHNAMIHSFPERHNALAL